MADGIIHVGGWDGRELVDQTRRMLVFEPQLQPFRALEQNLGGRGDVTLINAAAGAKAGRGTMYSVEPSHSSSMLEPRVLAPGFERAGEETIRVTTVDAVVRRLGHTGIYDELVIDTQGYELEVLKGARQTLKRDIRRVECELHDANTYPGAGSGDDINVFLTDLGFTLTAIEWRDADLANHAFYERR